MKVQLNESADWFGTQALTYDNSRSLTSDGTSTYTWNAHYQLVGITGAGLSASFQYDARGRRTSEITHSGTDSYVYDGINIVHEQVSETASAITFSGRVDQLFGRTDAAGTMSGFHESDLFKWDT